MRYSKEIKETTKRADRAKTNVRHTRTIRFTDCAIRGVHATERLRDGSYRVTIILAGPDSYSYARENYPHIFPVAGPDGTVVVRWSF